MSLERLMRRLIRLTAEQPKAEVVEPVVTETSVYFLITGSFRSEENAISQANILKAEGLHLKL